jgi:hypothetical protein
MRRRKTICGAKIRRPDKIKSRVLESLFGIRSPSLEVLEVIRCWKEQEENAAKKRCIDCAGPIGCRWYGGEICGYTSNQNQTFTR